MLLSEGEAEARLRDLRHRRDALDRSITELVLFLELGRRLGDASSSGFVTRDDAGPAAPDLSSRSDSVARSPARAGKTEPATAAALDREPAGGARARQYGRALFEAAITVLEDAGRPLHAGEILAALATRGFSVPGSDPVAVLNTRLWKRSGSDGRLRRLGDAVYALETGSAER